MIASLASIALLLQQEPKITLDLPVSPLTEVMKEVARQTGLKHQAAGPSREEPYFVQVKEMPASRLREVLAKATGGKWIQSGDSWILQTQDLKAAQDHVFVRSVTEWRQKRTPPPALDLDKYEAAAKRISDITKEQNYWSSHYKEYQDLEALSPDKRLMDRMVLALPLSELTTIGKDEVRVFSLAPTALQKALPPAAVKALVDYQAEVALISDRPTLAPFDGDNSAYNPLTSPFRMNRGQASIKSALLSLSRQEYTSGLSAELSLYSSEGRFMRSAYQSLAGAGSPGTNWTEKAHPIFKEIPGTFEIPEEESTFAKDIISATGGLPPGQKKTPVSQLTKDRLMNMDKVDPLVYGATFVMRSFASAKGRQVVARINDMAILALAFGLQSRSPLQGSPLANAVMVATGTLGGDQSSILEEPDLIIFPPTTSEAMPPFSLKRKGCARLFRAAAAGQPLFDPLADLSVECESFLDMMLPGMLVTLFGRHAPIQPSSSSFELLKLYGLLTPDQRRQVKTGELVLNLSSLSPELSKHVRRILLGRSGGFQAVSPAMLEQVRAGSMTQEDFENMSANGSGPAFEFRLAPTVFLTTRDSEQGVLRIRIASKDVLMHVSDFALGNVTEATSHQTAWMLYQSEQGPQFSQVGKFAQGTMQSLRAVFDFNQKVVKTLMLPLPQVAEGAALKDFKDLPESFQAEVRKRLEDFRRQPRIQGGDGSGKKPPE